jgi:hypothetical protein
MLKVEPKFDSVQLINFWLDKPSEWSCAKYNSQDFNNLAFLYHRHTNARFKILILGMDNVYVELSNRSVCFYSWGDFRRFVSEYGEYSVVI